MLYSLTLLVIGKVVTDTSVSSSSLLRSLLPLYYALYKDVCSDIKEHLEKEQFEVKPQPNKHRAVRHRLICLSICQ